MAANNAGISTTINARLIPAKQYVTPVTGDTVLVNSNGYTSLLLNPAGTLATLTITLPGAPTDADRVEISSTQIVTALTMNGGTISGALTSLAAGGGGTFVYNSDSTTWLKIN